MKKIRVTIVGGLGRMGKIITKKILKSKLFELNNISDVKKKKSLKNIKINNNNLIAFKNTDVIIDFSKPEGTMEALKVAEKLKKNMVIGTTGFNDHQNNLIKKSSRKIAIFKSGNMSLGINILQYIAKILSKRIDSDYQISITDNHHKKKIDFPSGTALILANAIADGKNKNFKSLKGSVSFNKNIKPNKNKINFFIKRKGNTIGEHTINFNDKTENIQLKHIAFSRDLFADGALKAARWIKKKNKGLFDMRDMLNLK
jgi:4-hydroxy-tetrahydrodipicolinate reductase